MPCESRGGLQFHTKKVAPTVDICGLKPKGNDDDSPAIGAVTLTDDGSSTKAVTIPGPKGLLHVHQERWVPLQLLQGANINRVTLPTPEDLDAGL
ncbi:hypothetical protein N7471_003780 [Penicillium samsonianum]|uniref:uncharacterized protein n=1 Tax=Penicillium samsonianum TaxID=1882272 RepID=UPI002548FF06|nr:uncharacterized protein N7471_003780 [Penicillium samsonianum]KAJ6137294.1 hypothetical protein N7471_003780 [Penicillium samsonianum]